MWNMPGEFYSLVVYISHTFFFYSKTYLLFRSCPSNHYLFPGHHGFAESIRWSESIRLPLKNMVDKVCPTRRNIKRKLKALDFQV